MSRVAVLAPMSSELRPVVRAAGLRRAEPIGGHVAFGGTVGGAEVVAVRIGIGTVPAAAVADAVLDAHPVDHVLVVGIAGAVGATHPLGEPITPAVVVDGLSGTEFQPHRLGADPRTPSGTLHTGDELIRDPGRLAELERRGVVALDMETASVAAVCEARDLPWSVERAISDLAGDPAIDDSVTGLARPDGTPDPAAVARYLLRGPWRARDLARLGRQSQVAARVAAEAAVTAIRRLG